MSNPAVSSRTSWTIWQTIYQHLPRWLRSISSFAVACIRHPVRFPTNWVYDKVLRCSPGIERLAIPQNVSNTQYYVYKRSDKSQAVILKLPKFRHTSRFDLYRCRHSIVCELNNRVWDAHFPAVFGFRKGGSYEMEYVEGENLLVLYERLLSGQDVVDCSFDWVRLLAAIDDLLNSLRAYQAEHCVLKGEWKHHNLIYDEQVGVIKNVDIEAIVSYEDIPWANIESAERNLRELRRVVAMAAESQGGFNHHTESNW